MPPRTRAATYARRRKRRLAAVTNDLTTAEWQALLEAWQRCAYCGADGVALQKDCVLPISRGGRYTAENVVPACRSCNASKCNDEVTGWMRRKRLDERAFLERWAGLLHAARASASDGEGGAAHGGDAGAAHAGDEGGGDAGGVTLRRPPRAPSGSPRRRSRRAPACDRRGRSRCPPPGTSTAAQ